LAGLFVILGIVLNWIGILCFDTGFYKAEYEKLGTAAAIGMSQEDLDRATEVLLDYTRGAREDLDVTATVNGQERQVFNQREKLHMVDVRALYLGAMALGNGLLAAGLLFFLWAIFFAKRVGAALTGYMHANWLFLMLLGLLGLYAVLDFSSFWTGFHHVFFTNDLWLLDPHTDILIMMVPGQFFFDLVMRILAACLATLAMLFLGAALCRKKRKANKQANGI